MSRDWLGDYLKLLAVALVSLLLNLPLHLFRLGGTQLLLWSLVISFPFFLIATLGPFRQTLAFRRFFAERSFSGMLLRGFMTELAVFVGLLLRTAWPSLSPLGLQLGMTVGLFTPVPYATIDYPNASNRRYWTRMSLFLGLSAAAAALFAHGRPYLAGIVDVVVAFLSTVGGLWFGLTLGNRVNHWIVALRPVFALLRKLGTTLTAFAVGYLSIIVLFSTFFAALWRVQGPDAFSGLPKDPTLPVFLYFSLVTATTIGYGDIVPQSASARSLAGLESISSLAWTLVVFAALSVQFASRATESTPKDKDDKHYDGN
jgi:hypothetical protein